MSIDRFALFKETAESSLKNAEQWIKDARLLLENSSCAHGSAALRFAYEEIAKAFICWLVSERVFPAHSKPVRDVFRKHAIKNEVISGMCKAVFLGAINKRLIERQPEKGPTDVEIIAALNLFKGGPSGMEKLRQRVIYVDIDLKGSKISPETTTDEHEAKGMLQAVEIFHEYIKNMMEKMSEEDKKTIREFFNSMPKEMWKTGIIRYEWLRDYYMKHIQSRQKMNDS